MYLLLHTVTFVPVIACFYYLEFARQIVKIDKFKIYKNLQIEISDHLNSFAIESQRE